MPRARTPSRSTWTGGTRPRCPSVSADRASPPPRAPRRARTRRTSLPPSPAWSPRRACRAPPCGAPYRRPRARRARGSPRTRSLVILLSGFALRFVALLQLAPQVGGLVRASVELRGVLILRRLLREVPRRVLVLLLGVAQLFGGWILAGHHAASFMPSSSR